MLKQHTTPFYKKELSHLLHFSLISVEHEDFTETEKFGNWDK